MSDFVFGAPTDPSSEHPLVRFATERPISRSPLANAWLATDSTNGTRVLLKQFSSAFGAFIEDRNQFAQRIDRVAACEDPHLARLHWYAWYGDEFYVAFAWDDHDPLDQYVAASQNRMPMARRFELVQAAARAVDTLHANGLLHLSLTPASFGVDREAPGQVRLIDWGLMLPIDVAEQSNATFPGVWLDAAPYASAELLASERPGTSDDVYSLSCVAHEVLSGEHPFGRRPARDALALAMPPTAIADLAAPQVDALAEGLALERRARASRVGSIVAAFSTAPRSADEHTPAVARDVSPARHHDWRVLSALGLAVIVAFVLVWRSTLRDEPARSPVRSAEQDRSNGPRASANAGKDAVRSASPSPGAPAAASSGTSQGAAIPLAPSGIPGMTGSRQGRSEAPATSATAGAADGASAQSGTTERAAAAGPVPAVPGAPTDRANLPAPHADRSPRASAPDTSEAKASGSSASSSVSSPSASSPSPPSVADCRNCDCATLEHKRTFTTDPMRPEEQRFLARNCRR